MSTLSVSLDLESVLADIKTPFIKEYNDRHDDDINGNWQQWGFDDAPFDYSEFMEITTHNWKHNPHQIPPREPELSRKIFNLYQEVDTLDVVTGRRGVGEKLQAWLNTQGIIYDDFVVAPKDVSKAKLQYDIYIDDNPKLVPEVEQSAYLFVVEHEYNDHIDLPKNAERVNEIPEVTQTLTGRGDNIQV